MICRNILAKIPVKNIWVFITDRCNLQCDYCFFKYRTENRELSTGQIRTLLNVLPKDKRCFLVVSGGEPLLVWEKVKYIFDLAHTIFTKRVFTIQSNMYYWTKDKFDYVVDKSIEIEPGLDGYFETNKSHRRGIEDDYNRYIDNISQVVSRGIRIVPTMTVHPDEVDSMVDNFTYLVELGFYNIEVHPAFLAPWTSERVGKFLYNYKELLLWEFSKKKQGAKKIYLGKMYSYPTGIGIDLVVQPNGKVIPNWTLLSFREDIRDKFVLFELTDTGCNVKEKNLKLYLKKLYLFFKSNPQASYREFSNFNASLAIEFADERLRKYFTEYKSLTEEIVRLERPIVLKEAVHYECAL